MTPKTLYLDKSGQDQLKEGVRMFAAAVKSTLGPAGNTVLMKSDRVPGGYIATKDGVTVANELAFEDPVHNMAAVMMRQAARKTADKVGDGTTTSVVLTEAILNAYDKLVDDGTITPMNATSTLRGLSDLAKEVCLELDRMSIPVEGDMLRQVATISANNDEELGQIIAEAFEGVDVVTIEDSPSQETYSEVVTGVKVSRGWMSRHFVTDTARQECVLENPYVLLYDSKIDNLRGLAGMLEKVLQEGRALLIIADLSPEVLATLNANVLKTRHTDTPIRICAISPPDFGYRKSEKMSDLAEVLGGVNYSSDTGDNLMVVTFEGLGVAKRVVVSETMTLIEPVGTERTGEAMTARVLELEQMKAATTDPVAIKTIDSRIEAICGGYGVVYVGASTEVELREKKDRVDDAVCAVRAAKEEGALPGGGTGLLTGILYNQTPMGGHTDANEIAMRILESASREPVKQMLINSGVEDMDKIQSILNEISLHEGLNFGYDIRTHEFCNLVERGILDPCKVTKSALINAVSVATTILSTKCIVV